MELKVDPIGSVEKPGDHWQIVIHPEYRPALRGLSAFSHLMVLWWADGFDSPDYRSLRLSGKTYTRGPDELGVLATRSPIRPNPLMVTMVRLTGYLPDEGILLIGQIDARQGSPVVDLKPYHPSADRIRDVIMPEWCAHWPMWYEESHRFDWAAEFNF